MNSINGAFIKATIISFIGALFTLAVGAHFLDWLHPQLPCQEWEKSYFKQRPVWYYDFDKVSSFFWSTLCAENAPPVVVASSEGGDDPTFPDLLATHGIQANGFKGAHRGPKTFGVMLANNIHPDRLKNLRLLALLNPPYFSFARTTDGGTIRLTSISNFAYMLRVHSRHQKWNEFLLDSFYIGTKEYFTELMKFYRPPVSSVKEVGPISPPADEDFDFERNMMKYMTTRFPTYRSRFSTSVEPTRTLVNNAIKFINEHPEAKICLVLFPFNVKNFKYFGRDAERVKRELDELIAQVPPTHALNLQYFNESDKVFIDPMHFTPYGKTEVVKAILASDCAKRVLETP